jgi:hypothetical protein
LVIGIWNLGFRHWDLVIVWILKFDHWNFRLVRVREAPVFCTKCKFNSFDHLSKCPKCGLDWKDAREALQLAWLQSEGYNWFQQPPKTVATASLGFFFAPDASPNTALGSLDTPPDASCDSPLLIEEVTLMDLAEEKPTKETEEPLAIRESPDKFIPKELKESGPSREQPNLESPMKREDPILVEEIVYDFSAFEVDAFETKASPPSDADSSKPAAAGDLSGSNKDERP